jgi:hypothetical protein
VVYQMTKKKNMDRKIKTGAPERVWKETAQNSLEIQWWIAQPTYCYGTWVQII